MNTTVVIGCSNWRDYSFPAPIAALLWREVVGYKPLILLVKKDGTDWTSPPRNQVVTDFLVEHGLEFRYVNQVDPYESHVTAQNCRQHVAALNCFADDDWIMLSDADLWPLKRDFYHLHEGRKERFVMYYANGDHYQSYPTCHMTARARDWRSVMCLIRNDDLEGQLKKNLDAYLKPKMDGQAPSQASWKAWMNDQWMFTEWIRKMPWFPLDVFHIERVGHPPVDRLDRSAWPQSPVNLTSYTDSHILRPADQPENWPRMKEIVEQVLPKYADRIEKFRVDFVKGY